MSSLKSYFKLTAGMETSVIIPVVKILHHTDGFFLLSHPEVRGFTSLPKLIVILPVYFSNSIYDKYIVA